MTYNIRCRNRPIIFQDEWRIGLTGGHLGCSFEIINEAWNEQVKPVLKVQHSLKPVCEILNVVFYTQDSMVQAVLEETPLLPKSSPHQRVGGTNIRGIRVS